VKVYGIEHFGFTVPNLDEAVEFFEKIFGAVTSIETGKVDGDDEYMKRRLGVPGRCRIENIKVLRVGNGSNLELFQYSGEDDSTELKRNSQPGGFHVAASMCWTGRHTWRAGQWPGSPGSTFARHGASSLSL
jgi:catechol 2,3-dioxygenase-like lactoylglutathione lyase family enzyme